MANNKKTCFTAPLGLENRGNCDHERFKHMTVEKLQDLFTIRNRQVQKEEAGADLKKKYVSKQKPSQ